MTNHPPKSHKPDHAAKIAAMKPTHTPTPWTLEGIKGVAECDGMPTFVATGNDKAIDTQANAAFIVRAVNNHQALIDALDQTLASIESLIMSDSLSICSKTGEELERINDIIYATLKTAKGE